MINLTENPNLVKSGNQLRVVGAYKMGGQLHDIVIDIEGGLSGEVQITAKEIQQFWLKATQASSDPVKATFTHNKQISAVGAEGDFGPAIEELGRGLAPHRIEHSPPNLSSALISASEPLRPVPRPASLGKAAIPARSSDGELLQRRKAKAKELQEIVQNIRVLRQNFAEFKAEIERRSDAEEKVEVSLAAGETIEELAARLSDRLNLRDRAESVRHLQEQMAECDQAIDVQVERLCRVKGEFDLMAVPRAVALDVQAEIGQILTSVDEILN